MGVIERGGCIALLIGRLARVGWLPSDGFANGVRGAFGILLVEKDVETVCERLHVSADGAVAILLPVVVDFCKRGQMAFIESIERAEIVGGV